MKRKRQLILHQITESSDSIRIYERGLALSKRNLLLA